MATNTYVALDKVTVSNTTTNSISFTSIPSTYTDLVIVMSVGNNAGSGSGGVQVRYNSDSGSNYSWTYLVGTGSSAVSGRVSNATYYDIGIDNNTTNFSVITTQIMNYANTTTYKTAITRGNAASNEVSTNASLWRSTSAISSVTILKANDYFKSGSTFSLYGIKAWTAETTPKATGGYVYEDSTYYYHAFPFSSTFTPNQSLSCDYLVVAGGGGGYFSGAGAGGLRQGSAFSVTATPYAITVGAGGAPNANGTTSTFSSISASGGGKGVVAANGVAGGSGGGAGSVQADPAATGGAGNTGGYTPAEGYAGGNAEITYGTDTKQQNSGGGGGAGGVGGNGGKTYATGGNGGIGATSSLINSIGAATSFGHGVGGNYYFAGGGGGGGLIPGVGGYGGGGTADKNTAYDGLPQTGGGGSGATWSPTKYGSGGSGVVIIRYAK